MAQTNLSKAKKIKNDEFYTRLCDIEKELEHYTSKLKNKIIYCNCDNPLKSNFVKYFIINFNKIGLKELIASGYTENKKKSYALRIKKVLQNNLNEINIDNFLKKEFSNITIQLLGDDNFVAGDFRSTESISLLNESDVIITNPPFSLFREFTKQLIYYKKQFLIIGSLNAIQNKDFFPYLQNNKIWLGVTRFQGGATYFICPKEIYDINKISNPKNVYIENDIIYCRINGVRWYTNIDHKKTHKFLELNLKKTYQNNSNKYPHYENYDAINIDKVADIPCDYTGKMGVPISFMDKYCVEQFEIIGLGIGKLGKQLGIKPMPKEVDDMLKGHSSLWRIYYIDNNKKPIVPYGRIIIKRK